MDGYGDDVIHINRLFQIVESTALSSTEYRRSWLDRLALDDQLFQQSIITLRRLDSMRGQDFPGEERVLFHLIQRGVVDHDRSDRRWDSSTRSMRHTAAMGDRLWALILEERARVSVPAILID